MNLLRASAVAFLLSATLSGACSSIPGASAAERTSGSPYAKRLDSHGIQILATEAVADEYLEIAARIYDHMTARTEPYDLRELHRQSGFRILLITEEERFGDLPDYPSDDDELEQAGGLGGSIGEFYIGVRVGSPHTLIHELGHGIYHSAIQFAETGGATDEEGWYEERVQMVFGMDLDEAEEALDEGLVHEVLIAPTGTFSAELAAAWRNADENKLWEGEYASSEPNEYWAEGVALWFRAWEVTDDDPRAILMERDPMLHALCSGVFLDADWKPSLAKLTGPEGVVFEDESEKDEMESSGLFDLLDRDGNDELDPYEAAEAMLLIAAEADRDGSGFLSEAELREFVEEQGQEDAAERVEMFEEFDRDGDGRIPFDDLPEEALSFVRSADLNGDQVLTLEELLGADEIGDPTAMFEEELLGFLAEVDGDGDGAFELDDLPSSERSEFESEFRDLDADQNGFVTRAELLELVARELEGAQFEIQGTEAIMTGVIGPSTPGRVLELVLRYPNVETIVMLDVPGSMDDVSNLRAAMMVRKHGLATHVPNDGMVASGGTDFFLAGTRRSAGADARFGVHSWGGFNQEGADVPRDDPEHEKYLEFYRSVGTIEEFYWYTLEAASADDIHWMTSAEVEHYGMLTGGER